MKNKVVLIDGYNVIRAVPELNNRIAVSLEHAREGLITMCEAWKLKHSNTSTVCIVFDGDSSVGAIPESRRLIRIIFTRTGEEADFRIIDFIRKADSSESILIVSNDSEVIWKSLEHGASVKSVENFYQESKFHHVLKAKKRVKKISGELKLSGSHQKEITNELTELWCDSEDELNESSNIP